MALQFLELASLDNLAAALVALADDDVVCVCPPGSAVVDEAAVLQAFDALAAPVVLAAAPVSSAAAAGPPLPIDVPSPYQAVGPALIGQVNALRKYPATDAATLADAYLAGDDLDLDVGAELFLVRDGTGTDAIRVGRRVVATATGTRPAIVIGGSDDLGVLDARDDLMLVLGYDGAARAAAAVDVVAPDIIRLPFWTAAMCAEVLRAAEAVEAWGSDVEDPVPGVELSLAAISLRLFTHVEDHLERDVLPRWREVWPEIAWNGLHDAFIIKYTTSEPSELPLHHDVAQVSGAVRLNDGYEGGALEFPRQDWDNHAVAIGDLVAWPSLVTHPHRSRPVTRGVKYALTIWTRLPE